MSLQTVSAMVVNWKVRYEKRVPQTRKWPPMMRPVAIRRVRTARKSRGLVMARVAREEVE